MQVLEPQQPSSPNAAGLIFGIYPGMTGNEMVNTGPIPDDPDRTEQALVRLQPEPRPFLIRSYVIYRGSGRTSNQTPIDPSRYARAGRRLDFVICYRSLDGDLGDWAQFVRQWSGGTARTWMPFKSPKSRTTRTPTRAGTVAPRTFARPSSME